MSKRLQVVFADAEYRELQRAARQRGLTVSTFVRRALDAFRRSEPGRDPAVKIKAVREALTHSYPTADIDQMIAETERGYREGE